MAAAARPKPAVAGAAAAAPPRPPQLPTAGGMQAPRPLAAPPARPQPQAPAAAATTAAEAGAPRLAAALAARWALRARGLGAARDGSLHAGAVCGQEIAPRPRGAPAPRAVVPARRAAQRAHAGR
jgi:hypothetical protein